MDSETTLHRQLPHAQNAWAIALLALVAVGSYLVLHPYLGITHDARLYSLQALNHLHPELYGNDLFLRYGSQDDYTFFTPLYAAMIAWLGVEPAAALLTFLSQMAFLTAALVLARKLMPTHLALMAVGLLVLLPGHYGSGKIFHYLEAFVTPRLFAESLVLLGLATWLGKRYLVTAALIAGAMLTHPLMGLAGVALIGTLAVLMPYWRSQWLRACLLLSIIALAIAAWIMPARWRVDAEWLEIVLGRAEYLALARWSADDWGRVVTVVATLAIAIRCLSQDTQRLATAALISTSVLMVLAWIGGDLLHIALVLQAQSWRALWLATVIAVVLLPSIFANGLRERHQWCSLLLLAAAWLSPSENVALVIAPLAFAAMAASKIQLPGRLPRILTWGAGAALAMMLTAALAGAVLAWQAGAYNIAVSPLLDAVRVVSAGGVLPLAAFLTIFRVTKSHARQLLPALTVLLGLLLAAAAVPTVDAWLTSQYDSDLKDGFAEWRARIPPGSDVMWATDSSLGADSAMSAWLLLERPHYVSRIQGTTSLFSRPAAMEIRRRTQSLRGLLPDIESLYPKKAAVTLAQPLKLSAVCRSASVRYIVTNASFVDASAVPASGRLRNPFRNLKLYICP